MCEFLEYLGFGFLLRGAELITTEVIDIRFYSLCENYGANFVAVRVLVLRCLRGFVVWRSIYFVISFRLQATLADSFLADLEDLSDEEIQDDVCFYALSSYNCRDFYGLLLV